MIRIDTGRVLYPDDRLRSLAAAAHPQVLAVLYVALKIRAVRASRSRIEMRLWASPPAIFAGCIRDCGAPLGCIVCSSYSNA